MKETQKNIAVSIHARLKNESELQGRPFTEMLQYYGMERFLYRLSKSQYVDKFVLKGGLLLYSWNVPLRRPTRDMDFRGYLDNSNKTILRAIQEVIAEPVPEDGIVFDPNTINIEQTQIDADYEGIRVKLTGYLGRARIPMQIDIGFSDVIASRVKRVDYPTLLSDKKALQLKGYPRESIVSEKFHAMICHAELNSRFKDYYDIWLIAENFEFESLSLQKAIEKTFAKRQTEIPSEKPVALTSEFAEANREKWKNFLKKFDLGNKEIEDFADAINRIWSFLECPIRVSLGDKPSKQLHWSPRKGWK
ncbi:MAG: nucleotidyl transferase AbiEii/AbiGii toxin family protein [Anaerolineales bacterium]|nr:nucleotidyl transferase AbiEii/AbiGii toxin family protein [Anaerolineales bacterium]